MDLSDAATQPMRDPTAGLTLSYNGEVYNYPELGRELRALGHTFTSTGDTEVVLAAYREWGVACLERFVGMFSLLLVDERAGILIAARDPFGIKPLYYSAGPDSLVFASEIRGLREALPGPRRADMTSVVKYLRYGNTDGGETTMFADVKQLPAGHHMTVSLRDRSARVQRYFNLDVQPLDEKSISLAEAAVRMRELLEDSVALHLRSDVTVGAALSGGLDSSAIVSLIPRVPGSRQQLQCFTYSASGSPLDETHWADLAARAAGAASHYTSPDVSHLLNRLPEVTRAMGEPLPTVSMFAQYCVFELARSAGVKVLLDGQGADEILGGYDRYVAARVASLVRAGQVRRAHALAHHAASRGLRIGETLMRATDYFVPTWAESLARRAARRPLLPDMAGPELAAFLGDPPRQPNAFRSRSSLRDRLAADLTTNTLPGLLRYEDRNSMAWSVESRVPFLTPDVARFSLSLPEPYLVGDDGTSKLVLREAMKGIVPQPILDRREKIGYAPPASQWFTSMMSFAGSTLTQAADILPFLNADAVRSAAASVAAGGTISDQVWRVVFLAMWTTTCDVEYG